MPKPASKPPRVAAIAWAADGALAVLTGRAKDTACQLVRKGKPAKALPAVKDAAFIVALPSGGVLTLSPKGKALLADGKAGRESATGFPVESVALSRGVAWAGGEGCSLARFDEATGGWVKDESLRAALAKELDAEEPTPVHELVEGPRGLCAAVETGSDGSLLVEHDGTKWLRRGETETIALAFNPDDGTLTASTSDHVVQVRPTGAPVTLGELEYASGLAWLDGALLVATGSRVIRIEQGVPCVVLPPGPPEPRHPFAVSKARVAYACGPNVYVLSERGERVECWFGDDPRDPKAIAERANQLVQKALKGRTPPRFKLSNKQLRHFPEALLELPALQALDLSMNELPALPEQLGRLAALEELSLQHNHLTTLPDAIGRLTKLRRLDLHLNCVASLPASFGGLVALEELDLGMNTSLQTLEVKGALPLREVPAPLRTLRRLRRLVLSMNELSSLPPWFAELESLEYLDVSSNRFEAFPDVLLSLPKLKGLSIGYQPWTSGVTPLKNPDGKHHAPKGLEKVCRLKGLVELAIDRLALPELPEDLGALTQLEVLHAGFNAFTRLPESFFGLSKLRTFTIAYVPLDPQARKALAKRLPLVSTGEN